MSDRPRPPDDDAAPDDAAFQPFANDSQVMTFADGRGELSIENGTDALLLHGDLEFAATPECLARLRALRKTLARIEAEIVARLG